MLSSMTAVETPKTPTSWTSSAMLTTAIGFIMAERPLLRAIGSLPVNRQVHMNQPVAGEQRLDVLLAEAGQPASHLGDLELNLGVGFGVGHEAFHACFDFLEGDGEESCAQLLGDDPIGVTLAAFRLSIDGAIVDAGRARGPSTMTSFGVGPEDKHGFGRGWGPFQLGPDLHQDAAQVVLAGPIAGAPEAVAPPVLLDEGFVSSGQQQGFQLDVSGEFLPYKGGHHVELDRVPIGTDCEALAGRFRGSGGADTELLTHCAVGGFRRLIGVLD